jgi:chloride channel protein, CIC family
MLGGTVGSVAHRLLPTYTATPGAYALVGMGTAFAGIVRAPMTSVLMIFETTRDYTRCAQSMRYVHAPRCLHLFCE